MRRVRDGMQRLPDEPCRNAVDYPEWVIPLAVVADQYGSWLGPQLDWNGQ
jgi:hypothetical protein